MTLTTWHPFARQELFEASDFYEAESPGLGGVFIDAVEQALARLEKFPLTGPNLAWEVRRLGVPNFPYGVVYRFDLDRIFILAIAHDRRRPRYWAGRR